MWANTSISTLTWLTATRHGRPKHIDFLPFEGSVGETLKKAKMPFVRTTFGSIEADHYTPLFAVLNLRDPDIRAYWLKRWGYARRKVGLGGIFLDSSFNLSRAMPYSGALVFKIPLPVPRGSHQDGWHL